MSSELSSREKLPPNVLAAGWVSFFTDLGSEMIYPILPAYITGSLGASRSMLGLIEGMAEATPALFKLMAGVWADRVKSRKWLIFLGYGISSFFKPFIGLAVNAWQVFGFRFLDRIGKGIRTAPRDALIADSAGEGIRGRAFGFHRAMDHLGALGGGLVAWVLLWQFNWTITQVILFSIVPGVLCLLTILALIQEIPAREEKPKTALLKGVGELPPAYWKFLIGSMGFAIANSSDAFLLLRANEMGMSMASIPLVWSFLHLVKAVTCWYGGTLSDKVGPRRVIAGGWILYSGVYLGFAYLSGSAWVWALFGIYGIFFGATEGAAKAWVAQLVPAENRGTAYGVMGLVEGIMLLAASLLTGLLWDRSGGSFVPLATAAVFSLLAAFWLLAMVPEKVSQ